jgi:hypothetical protein
VSVPFTPKLNFLFDCSVNISESAVLCGALLLGRNRKYHHLRYKQLEEPSVDDHLAEHPSWVLERLGRRGCGGQGFGDYVSALVFGRRDMILMFQGLDIDPID